MRIIGLDYGLKRTGIATTDPLQLIATALDTVETPKLLAFLSDYCRREPVEEIVIGEPVHTDGTPTYLEEHIGRFIADFSKAFPDIKLSRHDETRTSKKAMQYLVQSGVPKMKRRDKALTDKMSALVILQEYLGYI